MPPTNEKLDSHAVCFQGDQIIVAGGDNGPNHLDTCEAFDTKSKRFVLTHPCRASHNCLNNAYSVNVNLPPTCSWSTLTRMTAARNCFSQVCLPPDERGLIATGGYNGNYLDVVECLDVFHYPWTLLVVVFTSNRGFWLSGAKPRVVLIRQPPLLFTTPTARGLGQWVTLKPTLPRPKFPRHITICGNSLYLVSKFTLPT